MNGDLVGDAGELAGKTLDALDEERGVLQTRSFGSPRTAGKNIRARVDSDGESGRVSPRAVQDVAAVTGAHVHDDAAESGG